MSGFDARQTRPSAERPAQARTDEKRRTLSVIGGGAWGIALASAAVAAGGDVLVYSRRARELDIAGARTTDRLSEVSAHAHLILLAVPSDHVRALARELGATLDGRHAIVHGVRGLVSRVVTDDLGDAHQLDTIAQVLRAETPVRRLGALGGPVLTDELAKGAPSVMVVASHYPEVIALVRHALGTSSLRIYSTEDLTGLEWASALTGILAVAVGFARGVGLGAGVTAAFVTRAVHEAARIAVAAGAEERTFLGLGGFGDLLASIAEEARPEVRLGEAVARGTSVEEAIAALGQRIEAIELAPRVAAFALQRKVNAPIFTAVAHGILSRRPAEEMVRELMTGAMMVGT